MDLRRVVSRNLETVRQAHGEPLRQAGGDDVDSGVIRRLEALEAANVFLDRLYQICDHYQCSLLSMVQPGDMQPWPAGFPQHDALDQLVRRRLRQARQTQSLGTPSVARAADIHQSWLVRIESGEYRRIDLVRVERVARALRMTLVDLLKPEEPRTWHDDDDKEGAGDPGPEAAPHLP